MPTALFPLFQQTSSQVQSEIRIHLVDAEGQYQETDDIAGPEVCPSWFDREEHIPDANHDH